MDVMMLGYWIMCLYCVIIGVWFLASVLLYLKEKFIDGKDSNTLD